VRLPLAHGGTAGAIAEAAPAVAILVLLAVWWIRERRRSRDEGPD
jgi:hypothetical protein